LVGEASGLVKSVKGVGCVAGDEDDGVGEEFGGPGGVEGTVGMFYSELGHLDSPSGSSCNCVL
jgi:hypothetical protein